MLDKKLREKWKRAVLLLGCMALVFSGCGKTGDVKESGVVESQTAAEQAEEVTETTEVSETVFQIPENYAVVITVKINPELRIYLDENANVLAVEPVNEDAQKLIAAMQLEGMTFETCMEKMIAHAHEMGYLKEDGTIQVTAEGDAEELCSQILEKAKISISNEVEKENIQVSLKIADDKEIVIAGQSEKSTKDTSKKQAANKGKKTETTEQNEDKTVVAEVTEAKQQSEEKNTQHAAQNNTQQTTQNNNQQTAQQPEESNSQKTEEKDNQQPEQKPEQKPDQQPEQETEQPAVKDPAKDPAYHLVWQDEFEGTVLDRSDWNVELHDPGWVNSELQAYVDTEKNIYVKDGKLIIQPEKTEQDGKVSYTSGRVNTQGKKDFKYGYFECRAKVPQGTGYLPAFWMMPTNENLYGQWPKCGEIDIMEVMGQQTNKLYGTIHYGEPHAESQGTKILTAGDFADEYHTFACEWEPGAIRWYVDGILYHEENDWYSTTKNVGTVAYPAPFDQPFYMILNVAVGGSWVGNIDDTTPFDEKAQLAVDYVRVYQKDSYDENVKRPEKNVVLRDPDTNGNYVNNGNFAEKESLTDEADWKFMTANGGAAEAVIENSSIKITTEKEGTVDYSVQLVQAGIPFKKGATYEVSYEAKSSENRTMNTAVKAPDRSYMAYLSENASLTTDWKTYRYSFKMTEDNDANGRLEYNMGAAGSAADIEIRNVAVKMTKDADPNEVEEKTILANGSLVYNGDFQEGEGRLAYWEISDASAASVTNVNNERELHVQINHTEESPLTVSQSGLAFTDGINYELSFVARGNADLKVSAAGAEQSYALTDENQTYTLKISAAAYGNKDLVFTMSGQGEIYLDQVKIVEDSLIKNGSFNAGLSGYEFYKYSDGLASIVVDSLTENNAADITINSTGDTDWYIQLKQNNVALEKDQWYRLKFDVKSNLARKIMYAIQRDGSSDNDWTPYTGSKIIDLAGDGQYQNISYDFKMSCDTDLKAILSFTLGAVDGQAIDQKHRICLDNISLEKIDAPEIDEPVIEPVVPAGENMLTGLWSSIADECNGTQKGTDGTFLFTLENSGTNNWDVQAAQQNLTLIQGNKYEIKFNITSSIDRVVKLGFRDRQNGYKGFYGDITLKAGETKEYTVAPPWSEQSTETGEFVLLLGTPEGGQKLGEHTITVENISAVMLAE